MTGDGGDKIHDNVYYIKINLMAGVTKLVGGHIINKFNKDVDLSGKKYKGKIIGLYFSAHWCPPCRSFSPLLTELYQEFHEEKNFEIILISSDHDQRSFNDYYKTMPWLALDYKERRKREELIQKFNVKEIPKLVLIDGDSGEIICTNAKEQILYLDTEGIHFPWKSSK